MGGAERPRAGGALPARRGDHRPRRGRHPPREVRRSSSGPRRSSYRGTIRIEPAAEEARDGDVRRARAADKRGQGDATATIATTLAGPEGGGTRVDAVIDLTLAGRLASFGHDELKDIAEPAGGRASPNACRARLAAAPAAAGGDGRRGGGERRRRGAAGGGGGERGRRAAPEAPAHPASPAPPAPPPSPARPSQAAPVKGFSLRRGVSASAFEGARADAPWSGFRQARGRARASAGQAAGPARASSPPSGSSRSSQRGSHQLRSPSSCITAGTSTIRTTSRRRGSPPRGRGR